MGDNLFEKNNGDEIEEEVNAVSKIPVRGLVCGISQIPHLLTAAHVMTSLSSCWKSVNLPSREYLWMNNSCLCFRLTCVKTTSPEGNVGETRAGWECKDGISRKKRNNGNHEVCNQNSGLFCQNTQVDHVCSKSSYAKLRRKWRKMAVEECALLVDENLAGTKKTEVGMSDNSFVCLSQAF